MIRELIQIAKSNKNLVQAVILGPIFMFLLTLTDVKDTFYHQRAGLMVFVGLCIGGYFYRIYGKLFGLFAGYCAVSAFWAGFARNNKFLLFGATQPTIQYYVCLGALSTLAIWVVVSSEIIKRKTMAYLWLGFGIVICLHHLFLRGFVAPNGFLMTPSLAGVFLILLLPTAMKYAPTLMFFFIPMALYIGHVTAWAAMACFVFGYFLVKKPNWKILFGLLAAVGCGYLAYKKYIGPWGLTHHRVDVWMMVWKWFNGQEFQLFGTGAGSGYVLVPILQQFHNVFPEEGYVYLHNDLLQVLLELGWFGFGLLIVLIFSVFNFLYKSKNIRGMAFFCSLIPTSVGMFVWRHETMLFLAAWTAHDFLLQRKMTGDFKLSTRYWNFNEEKVI